LHSLPPSRLEWTASGDPRGSVERVGPRSKGRCLLRPRPGRLPRSGTRGKSLRRTGAEPAERPLTSRGREATRLEIRRACNSGGRVPGDPYVEPHLSSAALLTIDTQNDFAEGPYTIAGTAAAASSIAGLARGWRAASLPIVHIVRFYRDDGSNVDACRRSLIQSGMRLVSPGSSGSQLVQGLPRKEQTTSTASSCFGERYSASAPTKPSSTSLAGVHSSARPSTPIFWLRASRRWSLRAATTPTARGQRSTTQAAATTGSSSCAMRSLASKVAM